MSHWSFEIGKNNPNLSDKVTVRSVNHFYVLELDKDELISLHVNEEVLENVVPWNVTWIFFQTLTSLPPQQIQPKSTSYWIWKP